MKALLALLLAVTLARAEDPLAGAKRIVFLGDSITHAGGFVADFEYATLRNGNLKGEVLNLGVPSETVSGLTEDGHADGKFLRPVLHERLARVLQMTRPDLIFACYGMNDGIYLPFAEERFARFRSGIEELHAAAEAAGARIIHVTPPIYDRPDDPDHYGEVLDRYSAWLVEQRTRGWRVIDLHAQMAEALTAWRQENGPAFTFQKDHIHPGAEGHWVMARILLHDLYGNFACSPHDWASSARGMEDRSLPLIAKRNTLLRDAWVHACGHQRPGLPDGLPVVEAEKQAAEMSRDIALAIWGDIF